MPKLNARTLQPGERIRVLIVDDSVVIRSLVTQVLEMDPSIEVAGSASNGAIALQRIPQLNPDVLVLDIEMPEMDGLETLRRLRREYSRMRVVMFSTLTERGAAITLEALSLGADDYVAKASDCGSLEGSMFRLRDELIPKIKQFFNPPPQNGACAAKLGEFARSPILVKRSAALAKIVLVGVSTGGPAALGRILPHLPSSFPLPVLVVQHMPAPFTQLLADRLRATCALPVNEAGQGELLKAGKILIAPGDFHMRVVLTARGSQIFLDQSEPLNSCRPAVDALFLSAAEIYGGAILAVVLTGMGRDGLNGARVIKACGGLVLAQDEASSVVWGMPGAIAQENLADQILPLDSIVPEILRRTGCN